MDREEFTQICNDGADAGFVFCGPARPNAVEAVKAVKRLGHEVIIITDRQFGSTPEVSHNNTREWLAGHGIPYDELHFNADKTVVPTHFFVEDKRENYDALAKTKTIPFLITRDWNLVPGGDDRFRISDVSDYSRIIEQITCSPFYPGG